MNHKIIKMTEDVRSIIVAAQARQNLKAEAKVAAKKKQRETYRSNLKEFIENKTINNMTAILTQLTKEAKLGRNCFKVCNVNIKENKYLMGPTLWNYGHPHRQVMIDARDVEDALLKQTMEKDLEMIIRDINKVIKNMNATPIKIECYRSSKYIRYKLMVYVIMD